MPSRIPFVVALVALASCANLQPVPPELRTPAGRYDARCKSWLNDRLGHLVESWGPPTQQTPVPGGNTVSEWLYLDGRLIGPGDLWHLDAIRRHAEGSCDTSFTSSPDGRIQSYTWHGTGAGCDAQLVRDPKTGAWHI